MSRKRRLTIDKVWRVFSPFIKSVLEEVFGNRCISCGKHPLVGIDRQLGHFRPKIAYPRVRWWIKNLGIQCSRCNGPKQGASHEFAEWIRKHYGQEEYDELIYLSNQSHPVSQYEYEELLKRIKFYKKRLSSKKMTLREVYDDILNTKYGL